MKLKQNEYFLRNSKKSKQVWYLNQNASTLCYLMKENFTQTNNPSVSTNRKFPRVFRRRP